MRRFSFLVGLLYISFFSLSVVSAQENGFVSRYEFADLLESFLCDDCKEPTESMQNRYGQQRLEQTKNDPRFALDDLFIDSAEYQGEDYYYCVASVVDKGLMQGFPRATSPYCAGSFCGSSIVTFSELISAAHRLYCLSEQCTVGEISTQNPLMARRNELIDAGVFSLQEVEQFSWYKPLERNFITRTIGLLSKYYDCDSIVDSDGDGIDDRWDNCLDHYNPLQRDRDGDGVGDVCDDDIDGDGIKNAIGVVDATGLPVRRKVLESEDNCVFIRNPDQENQSGTILGDACFSDENPGGITIISTPRTGSVPLLVELTALGGPFMNVEWLLGDNYKAFGESVTHTYTRSGTKHVRAIGTLHDGTKVSAMSSIQVIPGINEQIGYQIVGSIDVFTQTRQLLLTPEYDGAVSQVTWKHGDRLQNDDPDETVGLVIDRRGLTLIESQAYNQLGERVGLSQVSLHVHNFDLPVRYSQINASQLTPTVDQTITVSTRLEGIDPDTISAIERGNGAGTIIESSALEFDFSYSLPGTYIITQKIFFEDANFRPHENIMTIHVIEPALLPSIRLALDPIAGLPGEDIVVDLSPLGINQDRVDTVIWKWGDNRTTTTDTLVAQSVSYLSVGPKKISVEVLLNDGQKLFVDGTVMIAQDAYCLGEDLAQYRCDMDGDGIPDLCDDDIDGDGALNWMGLLLWEPESCEYEYSGPYINQQLFTEYRQAIIAGAPLDNCFLTSNGSQASEDNNGRGDACLPDLEEESDGAGGAGGVPGGPGGGGGTGGPGGGGGGGGGGGAGGGFPGGGVLPGNTGGSGPGGGPDDNSTIVVETCTQCPCPEADYASTIRKGDRVRAILLDESGEIIYRYSKPEVINVNIPSN